MAKEKTQKSYVVPVRISAELKEKCRSKSKELFGEENIAGYIKKLIYEA